MVLRSLATLLSVAFILAAADRSNATEFPRGGERQWRDHRSEQMRPRHHHGDDWRHDRGDRKGRPETRKQSSGAAVSTSGLPSVIPGLGTYVGGIAAVSVKGVGNFFALDFDPAVITVPMKPGPRIILVDEAADACSYEAGICVIRP